MSESPSRDAYNLGQKYCEIMACRIQHDMKTVLPAARKLAETARKAARHVKLQ